MQKKAFTLFEVLLYIGIVSVVLLSMLEIGQNFILNNEKTQRRAAVLHNSKLAMRSLTTKTRGADALVSASSTLNTHPGVLTLDYPGNGTDVVFDTYLKNVTLTSGETIAIRKLRIQDGTASAVDLINDEVTVENFIVRDLTSGSGPKSLRLELTLATINTTGSSTYDFSLPLETSVTLRK